MVRIGAHQDGETPTKLGRIISVLSLCAACCCGSCVRTGFDNRGQQVDVTDSHPADSGLADGSLADSHPADGGPADSEAGDASIGAIKVSQLGATWSTPNRIRWQWQSAGPAASFKAYTLVVARSEADVLGRGPSARVWTAVDNPELGQFTLPDTSANDPVISTITELHQPNTTYHAQLIATDIDGHQSATAVATGHTTLAPTNGIVIFSEQDTAGYSLPTALQYTKDSSQAYQGSYYYSYLSVCSGGKTQCVENLRRQNFSISLAGIGPQDLASTAYYEMAVACHGPAPSYYSIARLTLGTSGNSTLWHNAGWTLRCDDTYRLLQIPLRWFANDLGAPLPFSELGRGLYEFMVGANWPTGTVRVDEVRIRW